MRGLLTGVVEGGTGRLAQVPGYPVGGKTGTTEKFEPDLICPGAETPGCYGDDVVASFIGIGPSDEPRLAIGVFVDAPSVPKKRTGGVAAAPAFSRVMRFALHQLGVPPDAR
jgi:cell division protein FtsI (penicillin-binding protein 3)